MSKVNVTITATLSEGVDVYSITVHDKRLEMTNDRGSIRLDSPGNYRVTYQFVGTGGDTLSISATTQGKTFTVVNKSTIPSGEHAGVGRAKIAI